MSDPDPDDSISVRSISVSDPDDSISVSDPDDSNPFAVPGTRLPCIRGITCCLCLATALLALSAAVVSGFGDTGFESVAGVVGSAILFVCVLADPGGPFARACSPSIARARYVIKISFCRYILLTIAGVVALLFVTVHAFEQHKAMEYYSSESEVALAGLCAGLIGVSLAVGLVALVLALRAARRVHAHLAFFAARRAHARAPRASERPATMELASAAPVVSGVVISGARAPGRSPGPAQSPHVVQGRVCESV